MGELYIIIYILFKATIFYTPHLLKRYHASYKRWLAGLLGKKSISKVSSFIFFLPIALFVVLILVFILLVLLLLLPAMFSEPIYCMDGLTEAHS